MLFDGNPNLTESDKSELGNYITNEDYDCTLKDGQIEAGLSRFQKESGRFPDKSECKRIIHDVIYDNNRPCRGLFDPS